MEVFQKQRGPEVDPTAKIAALKKELRQLEEQFARSNGRAGLNRLLEHSAPDAIKANSYFYHA